MSSTRRVKCATVVLCLLLAAGSSSGSQAAGETPVQRPDIVSALRRLIENPAGLLSFRLTAAEQRELASLYGGADGPLWVDTWGRPNRDAREALNLLKAAADDGLDPGDYNVPGMAALFALISDPSGASASNIARFDASLSVGTLRYLSDLHLGRVDPRAMGFRVPKQEPHDFVAPLRAALAQHRIPALAVEFAPSLAVYQQLRGTLARYRTLASDPQLQSFTLPAVTVRPGEPCTSAVRLARRLEALGDLPWAESRAHGAAVYDGSLVEGVRRFQRRHGLEPDGVLGPATRAALNVPIAWRARQIELALERLRWVPDIGEERFLAVNIPMFRVWGIQPAATGSTQSFSTEVIVGRALNTQTPVLVEDMEHVIFRPYWNVPSSIVRNEIVPAVRRDANYLRRQNMEIVEGQSDNARVVPVTAANLERARLGVLRIRQRPGAHNSLGLVKFVFPNDASVYMHGTPAQALFSRPRRDFSHGCIRVADPVGLAQWVLSDHPEWTRDQIISAMNGHQPRRVDLRRPIRVVLFYITAVVTLEEGVHFVNDIYGHDARLDAYLTRRLES